MSADDKKRISIRLDDDRHRRVACIAALMGQSVNEIVVEMLDEWVERHQGEAKKMFADLT